eukprot:TRINITY_DN5914_c0_g1_i1.p1 TRINITY_DN5914_c0_g1~~TRINITY_DN5914_c0_g1_i1.p1  ORF type:complete len:486 (+),score=88.24 TRINITY_DN5914_c0_g1_i1:71-1528(+)
MSKLLSRCQRRWKFLHTGKGSPNTTWTGVGRRETVKEYVVEKALEEDRSWNTQPLTKKMQKMIMKYRWQDSPRTPRIKEQDWIIKKNEIVEVVEGQDKGRRGIVIDIFYPGMVLKVEGVRLEKVDGTDGSTGERVTQFNEDWIRYDEVRPIDPTVDEPCDVEFMKLENSATGELTRTRVSKRTGSVITDPQERSEVEASDQGDGLKDTPKDIATQTTLAGGSIGGEINKMALVKLSVLEDWFTQELEKLHTKDQNLRNSIAAEKKEFQHATYHRALEKVMEKIGEDDAWMIEEVQMMRAAVTQHSGQMPDFVGDQERYRDLRRAARFQIRREMKPVNVESLQDRYRRTSHRGAHLMLNLEAREKFERSSLKRKQKTTGKMHAMQNLRKSFKMSAAEYLQDALEIQSSLLEQLQFGQSSQHQQETYIGWKPAPLRKRDELDQWSNRFGHMEGQMGKNNPAAASKPDGTIDSEPASTTPLIEKQQPE